MTDGKKKSTSSSSSSGGKQPKSADISNITNGIQRLQVSNPKTPKIIVHKHEKGNQNPSQGKPSGKGSAAGTGKKRQEDAFGKKDLYAGAGFDLSPAASSLPMPKFALGSSKPPSTPATPKATDPNTEADALRVKSEYLMKVLARKDGSPNHASPRPTPNTDQLEEMTAQVRRLLNL